LTSLSRSQRWTDLQRDPRVAVVIDAGEAYWELRGVELRGRVEVVGEVPRTGESNPELEPSSSTSPTATPGESSNATVVTRGCG
jgi:hypothetical protein